MTALPDQYRKICRVSFGTVVQEKKSGLVRIYPERSQEQMSAVHTAPEYFNHPYFVARRKLSNAAIWRKHVGTMARMAGGAPQSGQSLLDIGCDTGAFLVTARDVFGLQVTGLEVSPHSAEVARSKNGLNVIVGDALSANLPDNAYDYITMIDVIEHIANPVSALKKLSASLKPGGKIYIVTLNHDALIFAIGKVLYTLLGKYSLPLVEKLYIPYHEYYFTPKTLTGFAEEAGLRAEKVTLSEFPLDEFGHGWLLMCGLAPIFLLQKMLGMQTLQEMLLVRR